MIVEFPGGITSGFTIFPIFALFPLFVTVIERYVDVLLRRTQKEPEARSVVDV